MNKTVACLVKWLVVLGAGVAIAVAVGTTATPTSGEISPLETIIRGQSQWLAGGPASLRVIVKNHETGEPVQGAAHFFLTPTDQQAIGRMHVYSGRLRNGTLDAKIEVPKLNPGTYELEVRVLTRLGMDEVKRPVNIVSEARVLLTTDKPLYQPGQTIHLRALALSRPAMAPAAGAPVTLEVEDAKGNKVFKKRLEASKFGVVSAEFILADEINMGRYTVRAVMAEGSAERTVEVKRYVLPKFKVGLTTDRSYYLPGEMMTGKVQCDYFFGKPTSKADVLITVSTFDVGFTEVAEIQGTTNENGTFEFETELPDYFVGQPLEQGKAFVKLDVEVTDRAEHTEKVTEMVPVAKDPVVITVVPESGEMKVGLDNVVYILFSAPDGKPIQCTFQAEPTEEIARRRAGGAIFMRATHRTDAMGVGEYHVAPEWTRERDMSDLTIIAYVEGAGPVERRFSLGKTAGDSLILRADRALAKVGDAVEFTVISTKQKGTTYVDVIRDSQTVLTQAVDLEGGRAELSLPLTQDLAGTLEVHAYQILPDENIIRDTRLLYVEPADDLVVEVRADQETYRPGDPAELKFTVRDPRGTPVMGALGVTIVDESVFALQEMQPGLERVYFALEKELMKPRYEIHGFTAEGVVTGHLPFDREDPAGNETVRQRAAKVLFAASQPRDPHTLVLNTYEERLQAAMEAWVKEIARDAEKIDRALAQYQRAHGRPLSPDEGISVLVDEGLLKRSDLRDRWGSPYRVRWHQANCWLDSSGPDGKWETRDDILNIGQWMREGVEALGDIAWGRAGARGGGVRGPMDRRLFMADALVLEEADMAMPMKAMAAPHAAAPGEAAQPQVRLRQFFPETMYVNPAVITDERGRATVTVDMADSITTWRLQALASSQRGRLGSVTSGLRVFQDFFIDIDLPVALTQNDEISIPIAIYNYLPDSQTVKLTLEVDPWFELVNDEAEKSVEIAASDIRAIYYRIRAKGIGTHSLTVHAKGSRLSDAIRRQIDVMPDGEEQRDTWNDRLDDTVERTVTIPPNAIPGASTILVKIYPGLFSQAVEGLDALLRMPFGCFEQTSSVTYPNVLVLDYLKSTKQAKPELQMKAEQYINVGYQRLVSFEVPGGGFSWFGNPPAHKVLTAYGLMEFRDMSRVHEVDENIIARTQNWLVGRQQKDGSWERDEGGIAEGIINRQTDMLRVTAYITWALAESGYEGAAVERAFAYLDEHWREASDPYALAVIANAYLSGAPRSTITGDVLSALAKLAVEEKDVAYWRAAAPTFTSAQDGSADLETTALATYALVKSGRHVTLTNKAITYLIRSKDSFGTWQTTQATVWSLKALLLSLQRAAESVDATVEVEVNGKHAASFDITSEDYEVVRQVDAREIIRTGENEVHIALEGKGSVLYQIVNKYYLPWTVVGPPADELLEIDVDYDRTRLAANDTVTASVRVVNNDPRDANMVVIDLGLPPGFTLLTEDLDELVEQKTIQKYTVAARQIIVYLERLASHRPLEFSYRLQAKFPIKAATPASRVYRYYNPEIEATAEPVALEVR